MRYGTTVVLLHVLHTIFLCDNHVPMPYEDGKNGSKRSYYSEALGKFEFCMLVGFVTITEKNTVSKCNINVACVISIWTLYKPFSLL